MAKRSGLVWAGIVPIVLLVGWAIAKGEQIWSFAILAGVEALLAGLFAGPFVGRAVICAQLAPRLCDAGLEASTEPDHLDGAAGLRPVGELYFFQASVLAVPAIYLAAWWYVFPLLGDRYSEWSDTYVGLLAFVVALALSIHRDLDARRVDHVKSAPDLGR